MGKLKIPLFYFYLLAKTHMWKWPLLRHWISAFWFSFCEQKRCFPILFQVLIPCLRACVIVWIFNNWLPLWCLTYLINCTHFPYLSLWVLDWWCSFISQQMFHGPLILACHIPSPSSHLCHAFIIVITRFAQKQNNWSHGVYTDLALIGKGPTVEPCGVPMWWLS